jgi:hypothetical protein
MSFAEELQKARTIKGITIGGAKHPVIIDEKEVSK